MFFDFFYGQFGMALPKIVMYNHKNNFVVDGKNAVISSEDEFKKLLINVISKNHGIPLFIKKTHGSYGGKSIYKVFAEDIVGKPEMLHGLYEEVIRSGYLFQKTIKQHPKLDQLNPSCLNTLRLDTFINKNGEIEVISSYFKTNIKNHFIDNDHRGGCEVPIDMATGKLKKFGHLTLRHNGLDLPAFHPVTKVAFDEFEIPFFNEGINLVIQSTGCHSA